MPCRVYTLTTLLASINISTVSIRNNDSPATTSISCVEVVYNNATASVVGNSLVVNGTIGQGLVIVKYLPKNKTSEPP